MASDFCATIPDERCPEFLEAVLRGGIPVLAETSNPEEYPQVYIFSCTYFSGDKRVNIYIEQQRGVPSGLDKKKTFTIIPVNITIVIILPVLTEKSNKIG